MLTKTMRVAQFKFRITSLVKMMKSVASIVTAQIVKEVLEKKRKKCR